MGIWSNPHLRDETPAEIEARKTIVRSGSVDDIADAAMLERVVRNARPPRGRRKSPRWVAVMELTALGSTYATQLCRRFGMDPDEIVR